MVGDGSGANRTIQVKFIVDPMLINSSGLPRISVIGSETKDAINGSIKLTSDLTH